MAVWTVDDGFDAACRCKRRKRRAETGRPAEAGMRLSAASVRATRPEGRIPRAFAIHA